MRFLVMTSLLILVVAAWKKGGDAEGFGPPEKAEFDGLIEPYRLVNVSSEVDGLLETVTLDRGDVVMAGQVLATLESSIERANLKIAATRAQSASALKRGEANLAYYASKLKQDEGLFRKGIISEQEISQARTDKLLAEAALMEAQEQARLAVLERERAEAQLALRTIRSPVSGVVVDRLLSPGELVSEARSDPIVRIAQIDPLRVEVILPLEMLGQVKPGTKAEVRPEPPVAGVYVADVVVVDQVIDAASSTFGVRLELPNEENELPAGLKCRIRFMP